MRQYVSVARRWSQLLTGLARLCWHRVIWGESTGSAGFPEDARRLALLSL